MRSYNSSNSPITMTLNEIRTELVTKTERKIQEMKSRNIILPERRADLCELCDMLSQEIYDFAVKTTIQIADRNHLRRPVPSLLADLQDDIHGLTNGAVEIILAASNTPRPDQGRTIAAKTQRAFTSRLMIRKPNYFQLFFSRVKAWWGLQPVAC